ncbi:apolipoprotein L2-like [Phyllostomus discolor]|uniref:Apolipoprotein L2-like n=1 Tax=Phyllostomus discolor TaxID=89673 RepID=A0A7E6D168_9CHIR|nr:apolipoprotein L2-like [Phyllostomus discolor]
MAFKVFNNRDKNAEAARQACLQQKVALQTQAIVAALRLAKNPGHQPRGQVQVQAIERNAARSLLQMWMYLFSKILDTSYRHVNCLSHSLGLRHYRGEADALYEDLNLLKGLMAVKDKDKPSQDELFREMVLKEFPQVEQELEERIRKLYELADSVDKVHRRCTISNVVSSSTGIVSGILTIAGLSLAPLTAGASLVFAATGAGLGVASAVTSVSTSIVEISKNESAKATASHLVSDAMGNDDMVIECLRHSAPRIASLSKCIQSVQKIVKNVRAFKVAKARPLLAVKAKDFMTAGSMSIRSSRRVQKAFGGSTLAMTKGAKVFGLVTASAFLLVDVYTVVKESVHLYEGPKAELAEQLREQAQALERRLKGLRGFHKILQDVMCSKDE